MKNKNIRLLSSMILPHIHDNNQDGHKNWVAESHKIDQSESDLCLCGWGWFQIESLFHIVARFSALSSLKLGPPNLEKII